MNGQSNCEGNMYNFAVSIIPADDVAPLRLYCRQISNISAPNVSRLVFQLLFLNPLKPGGVKSRIKMLLITEM